MAPLPRPLRYRITIAWPRWQVIAARLILGIRWEIQGAHHLPDGPAILLSKHQSAWETIALQRIFRRTSFVYKQELHWLPFFGWGLALMPFVAIDRNAGKAALAQVADRGQRRLEEGYSVIVFPEGTRVAPGARSSRRRQQASSGAVIGGRGGGGSNPRRLS